MSSSPIVRPTRPITRAASFTWIALAACGAQSSTPAAGACDPAIALPAGFCAQVFADRLSAIRHLAVGPMGDVYVARWSTRGTPGGLVVLSDTDHDGRADRVTTVENSGGSGLALASDAVYMSTWGEVLRYPLDRGAAIPRAVPDTIVMGLPHSGHAARSIVLDSAGRLLVAIGAPSNSCQLQDRIPGSPGRDPCPEHDAFACVWRFDGRRLRQREADGVRLVSGLRHAVALAINPGDERLYAVQHGRDELHESFPALYDRAAGERLPAEEMFVLDSARDYGWPYCYWDDARREKVLAPEYGGDSASEVSPSASC
jgi:glucose/arabinose dehydrogenase